MENIGESKQRNEEFQKRFSRNKLIQNMIDKENVIIFDVGAHRGESFEYLYNLNPKAKIYSFEPDKESFEELSEKVGKRGFCFNFGFSDKNSEMEFYKNSLSHTNSLYKVNLKSKDSIKIGKANEEQNTTVYNDFNKETICKFETLESFWERENINNIDLLKIDVQGAEEKVLIGTGEKLKFVNNVILEISFFDYYEHQTSFFDIEKIILPYGFSLFSITEISNNPMNGRTDWVEVIYKKRTV